ncbi:hypothetical protein [Flavivirga spongiicola]|uniref:DUF3137 domain-containing protein n=1 Tax=Flavivirga spongiicola TaxID=421621 RepID=A0ABU7XZK9_9FLAO|nr:hypothetical protein [Flavivirga sp. MEBiC05379]MDO5980284.1 hypothetical protein [Flavivirga sp. MEBiC05379]
MKEYKVGRFWFVISSIKALAILFLAVIVPYWVFIEKTVSYKAGIVIGSIASLVLLYYGITELIKLSTGLKQIVCVDEDSISIGSAKLFWNEISTITFQPAVGFDPAIFIQSKNKNIEIGIPTLIGRNNLIELGRELEKRTRKYAVEINDMDGDIIDPDPSNIGMPVTLNFESSIKNMIALNYNTWLSGKLEKLDKKYCELVAKKFSFEGFYRGFTDKDKKLIEDFVKIHKFEDDEFLITSMANAYVMTNKNIFFPIKNQVISLKDIQSYSSKGWWTVTFFMTLISGEEIVIENLDGVPTDEYLNFFKK